MFNEIMRWVYALCLTIFLLAKVPVVWSGEWHPTYLDGWRFILYGVLFYVFLFLSTYDWKRIK